MPEDEQHDSRPHLVIPYWKSTGPNDPGDNGDTRPVPGNVTWYLCQAIHASPYQPGEQLDVSVEVANYGGANTPSIAQVTVWWADPSSGFVVTPDKLIGYTTVEVQPRGGQATTKILSKVIPASAPDHICLLARVSHQYDRAGTTVDSVNDRHWAQRNLVAVEAQIGVPMIFPFMAGNPFEDEAEFVVRIAPASEERFGALQDAIGAEPVFVDARGSVTEAGGGEGEEEVSVVLGPSEQREMQVHLELFSEISPEQFGAFEVSQLHSDGERIVGGLVVVLRGT